MSRARDLPYLLATSSRRYMIAQGIIRLSVSYSQVTLYLLVCTYIVPSLCLPQAYKRTYVGSVRTQEGNNTNLPVLSNIVTHSIQV